MLVAGNPAATCDGAEGNKAGRGVQQRGSEAAVGRGRQRQERLRERGASLDVLIGHHRADHCAQPNVKRC